MTSPLTQVKPEHPTDAVIETRHLYKRFGQVTALEDINIRINRGEFVAIIGQSGSGKSTMLNILGALDVPTAGEVWIDGTEISKLSSDGLAKLRGESIGFVFQFHYLLHEFSTLENVMIPALKLGKYSREEIEHRAMEKLRIFDMQDHALKKANQLSGGQKQRVAIARALINDPLLIMGDEPTGNLDKKNSDIVYDKFKELAKDFGQTMLIVTHDPEFAAGTDRTIEMEDGRVVSFQ
mgnify:CR=1 FL=1